MTLEPILSSARPGAMQKRCALLAPIVILVLAGCSSAEPAPSGEPLDPEGSWQLVSGTADAADIPIVDDHPITLTFEGSRISGTSACNSYGGRLAPSGGGIDIIDLFMTAMGCEQPVMDSEAAYTAALDRVDAIGGDDGQLVLTGSGIELRFEALAPPTTSDMVDTVWVLETLVTSNSASSTQGDPATLELRSDGTFSGSTGCRGFTGEWQEQGDQIITPLFAMDDNACPPNLAAQDEHVVTVIGDGFAPTLEENQLLLADRDGTGLIYRAED